MLTTLAQAATVDPPSNALSTLQQIVNSNNFPVLLIFGAGGCIAIVSVVFVTLKGLLIGRARERTRQEIAAYVAEGSISASEGERLFQAGESIRGKPRTKASPGGTVRFGVFKVDEDVDLEGFCSQKA